jgi:hypothetical protein
VVALGNVDILVCSGPEVDPNFSIPMPDPPVGWQRAWFLLRNDADAPLPTFIGGRPIPHPNWEYGVARANLHRLQSQMEIIQELIQRGLMGAEILQTFSAAGFYCFINERQLCRCLQGQVVKSAPSPRSRAARRSTPRYVELLLFRMWRGGRPVVSIANGCGHGGRGDG